MTAARPTVTLIDGRVVCSWSREWLEETRERTAECIKVYGMADRDTRRAYLGQYEARMAAAAFKAGHADPAAVGAEARSRLEGVIMDRWRKLQGASAA
ncbi:hypothetical protein [Tardiphaga sp. 862_B3_N1_1]|uniref:hypothetical protein n=1 Tax=Tardiphaga sp. 862_B3_N1_1 TaxID=3240763 RepID=UPI003F8BF7C0